MQLRSSALRGNGLFSTHAVEKDDVLLRVPLNACLVFQRHPEQVGFSAGLATSWRVSEVEVDPRGLRGRERK